MEEAKEDTEGKASRASEDKKKVEKRQNMCCMQMYCRYDETNLNTVQHKVHIYKDYYSVCPPRRNWDSPTPSLASGCAPPPEPNGGGGAQSGG
jgi:hypothetical protein